MMRNRRSCPFFSRAPLVLLLSSLEDRFSFLRKGLEGLHSILRVQNDFVRLVLCYLTSLPAVDRAHCLSQRNGTAFADVVGKLYTRVEHFLSRLALLFLFFRRGFDQPIAQAEKIRLGTTDSSTCQDQVAGFVHAYERGESVCPACAGDDGEFCLWLADDGGRCEDAESGAEGDFETATQCDGGDGADGGDGQVG